MEMLYRAFRDHPEARAIAEEEFLAMAKRARQGDE